MNLTYPTPDVNGFEDLFTHANSVTGSGFAPALLLAIFVITFISMKKYESSIAFLTASWVTAIPSYLMFFGGFLAEQYVILTTILLFVSLIVAHTSREPQI